MEVTAIAPENRIFIDETGSALNLTPVYGRAPEGQRVHADKPTAHGKRINTIGALTASTLVTALCFEGTLTGHVFTYFIQHFLAPHLGPGKVLILDNAKAHYDDEAIELIEQTGARCLFLPPYAPEMNPIEYCWATLKQHLRKTAARTVEALYQALEEGLQLITPQLAQACFRHCGFST